MVFPKKSLVDCRHLSTAAVADLYDLARKTENFDIRDASRKIAALVFLEPSTRTRCSFEVAAHRIGVETFVLEGGQSSRVKGETLLDTLLNLGAMDVDLFVVRHGETGESLADIAPRLDTPLINAGEGVAGHPTQALLDLFTLCEERKVKSPADLKERILFVGDLIHSRVARSNFELLKLFGIPFAFAAPEGWIQSRDGANLAREWGAQTFASVEEGLEWATVVMALRVQRERHAQLREERDTTQDELIAHFQLNPQSLKALSPGGLILHPGPVNWGVEMTSDVQADERCCILKQVAHGVSIRAALMARMMELV